MPNAFRSFSNWLWLKRSKLRYNTVQIVSIKNFKLCLLHILLQLGIILYIAVYAIYVKRGYQASEPVSGSTALKVKGSAYNSGSLPWAVTAGAPPADRYAQVYDSSDLIYPPTERDAVFITTNLWITPEQERGACYPGSDDWHNAQFPPGVDADAGCAGVCVRGTVVNEADTRSGGVWTGQYKLLADISTASSAAPLTNCYCELRTWCPDENIQPSSPPFHLEGVSNWTISVRQAVSFKRFDTTTSNMVPKNAVVPPIYSVGDVLRGAGLTYKQVEAKGATIVMEMQWNCDLDHSADRCDPSVSFSSLGTGYNFRRVEFDRGMHSTRQLIKHYGLRLLVQMTGQGSRFDAAALFTNIGAGIGLLAIASLLADFAAVNLLGHKALYEKAKYKHVTVKDGTIVRGSEETRRVEEAMAQAALAQALQARAEGKEVTMSKMDRGQFEKVYKKSRPASATSPQHAVIVGVANAAGGVVAVTLPSQSPSHAYAQPSPSPSPSSSPSHTASSPLAQSGTAASATGAGAGAGVEMQSFGSSPSPALPHPSPAAVAPMPTAASAGAVAASNSASPRRPADGEQEGDSPAAAATTGSHVRVHIDDEAVAAGREGGGGGGSSSTSARRRTLNPHAAWSDGKLKGEHQA